MIRLETVIKWTVFLAMMSAVYLILREFDRRGIITPFVGQIAFLIFMAAYLFLERRKTSKTATTGRLSTRQTIPMRIHQSKQLMGAAGKNLQEMLHH